MGDPSYKRQSKHTQVEARRGPELGGAVWRRILESRDRVPGGQTLQGKQHSEQSAPISSRVVTCLHPPEGGRKLPSMLLKTVCQAAKISDKLFLLQISWFQPRLHPLHLPAGPCSCNSTAHFLLRITERYFSSLPITPNLATQGSGPPSWKIHRALTARHPRLQALTPKASVCSSPRPHAATVLLPSISQRQKWRLREAR